MLGGREEEVGEEDLLWSLIVDLKFRGPGPDLLNGRVNPQPFEFFSLVYCENFGPAESAETSCESLVWR
jgi:hypothetical protein